MYSLLYRKLPGGKVAKALQLLLLSAAVLAILMLWVFPFADSLIPQDPSIDG
jgi:hypothetical protein